MCNYVQRILAVNASQSYSLNKILVATLIVCLNLIKSATLQFMIGLCVVNCEPVSLQSLYNVIDILTLYMFHTVLTVLWRIVIFA